MENKKKEKAKSAPSKEQPEDRRNTGRCPYFKKCGGCKYIDSEYEAQLKLKQTRVQNLLGSLAKKQNCKIEPIVGSEEPLYYRNKVHSVFSRDKKGHIVRGIYAEGTHRLVDVSGCFLEDRQADKVNDEIKSLLPSFKLKVYDEDTGFGWLRHVLVRVGRIGGRSRLMVVLVTASVPFPGKNNFVRVLREKFPEIKTIVQNINDKRTSMVLGERNIVIYGPGYVEDDSLGLKFRISPSAFFQINPLQTRKLYSLALEMAGLTGREQVVDAYCGTGTIGMFMSGRAGHVTGIELNRSAVRDAVANLKANNISNMDVVCADATEYLQKMASESVNADILCMDPPRSGSTPEFIKASADIGFKKIVYVSCNPETLAVDLKEFAGRGYTVRRIVPVDMFPQTEHVETVVLMSRVK